MLKIVEVKVKKALKIFAKKHSLSKKVVWAIERDVRRDKVLPMLALNSRTKVKFDWERFDGGNAISLYIGPRDFQWDPQTGDLEGSGTCLA